MRKNKKNRKNFLKTKLTLEQYTLLKECFRGGNTASNRYHTNMIIDNVSSYDITSSYPFVMMTCDFPIGKFMYYSIETIEELEQMNEKYCTIARYIFKNLRLKKGVPFPYIPFSKCTGFTFNKEKKETSIYNGRVMYADTLAISLTNIDYEIIKQQYDYDELYVSDFYFSRKGKLPKELRQMIMKYFQSKTELKGIDDMIYEYTKEKNKLNAIFGMCVTDMLHEHIIFKNGVFEIDHEHDKKEDLEKYYQNRNNFLSFQWGVFVTAHARKRLQEVVDIIGLDCVYTDTDSVKYINNYELDIKKINHKIINSQFDIMPKVIYNNDENWLGIWEQEKPYKQFITMGAKKYAYIYNDDKLGITVAGLNKKKGADELLEKGGLEYFKIGEVFYNSGRMAAHFNDDTDIYTINVNGCDIVTSSNVAIEDVTYTLGITDTMLSILLNVEDI